jgi:hypothetical protein
MVTSSATNTNLSQGNYSWSDDPNDDGHDTLGHSSKTSDQFHPDYEEEEEEDDVEMASRTMTTPTPSMEGDGLDLNHDTLPPSLPSFSRDGNGHDDKFSSKCSAS